MMKINSTPIADSISEVYPKEHISTRVKGRS